MENQDLIDIVIFCQNLRLQLVQCQPPIIRSRRQLFRLYENVFTGRDIFTWTLESIKFLEKSAAVEKNNNSSNEVEEDELKMSADEVLEMFQHLMHLGHFHCIHADIPFKADNSLYRFAGDDNVCSDRVEAFVKGFQLYKSICSETNSTFLQKVFRLGVLLSDKCMRGGDLLPWLVDRNISASLDDARKSVKKMLAHETLKPVQNTHPEFDEKQFYVICVDFSCDPLPMRQIAELLNKINIEIISQSSQETAANAQIRKVGNSLMGLSLTDIKAKLTGRTKGPSISSMASDDSGFTETMSIKPSSPIKPTNSYISLLREDGSESIESLLHPDAPFTKKELRIYPDAVGYGFIIRGSGPCFVKIVDPDSPAGKSGLKAYQFISDINGRDVLNLAHVDIENLILSGPKYLRIGLMCPPDDMDKPVLMKMTATTPKLPPPESKNSSKNSPSAFINAQRRMSLPVKARTNLPSAQPWIHQRKMSTDIARRSPYY